MDTAQPRTLLLIEDDRTIAELLAYNLRQAGYEVLCESDGRAGLETALSCEVELVIVDVMLPELDGIAVSREIARAKPDVPVIVLTARTDRATMLEGFESGADDFVTKPFDLDELLARISVRLRKSGVRTDDAGPVVVGGVRLDDDTHTLRTSEAAIHLKPKEHALLRMLLSDPGHLFPREEIARRVWHQQYTASSRTLDVHVRHLRAKLEAVHAPVEIQAVRGVGYRAVETPGRL